jgi:uncharacterized delta-60 repeat protein
LIVVAGTVQAMFNDPFFFGLARFDAAGNADPTFGSGGVVTTALANMSFGPLAVQPDGKIVVLGTASNAVVARFTSVGAFDDTFGGTGLVTAGCGSGGGGGGLALQPDGKILAAVGGCAFRYLPDGSPDPDFGTAGIVTLPGWDVDALALQADGGIVIAGENGGSFAVGHVLADGTVDMGFGHAGIATNPLSTSLIAADVAVQPDGKIVAVNAKFGVARFRANGSVDSAFGTDGMAIVTVTGSAEHYWSSRLAVQGDGKIVVDAGGARSTPLAARRLRGARATRYRRCARRTYGARASTEQRSVLLSRSCSAGQQGRHGRVSRHTPVSGPMDGRATPRVHVHVPTGARQRLQDRDRAARRATETCNRRRSKEAQGAMGLAEGSRPHGRGLR